MRKFISPCQLTSSLPIVNTLHQRCISTTLRLHQEEPTSSVPKTKDPKGHVLPKRKMPLVKNEKPIRTLFYVPGSSLKMLDKAWTLQPDNITLDLEDSVSLPEKTKARDQVIQALTQQPKHPTAEVAVRINTTAEGPQFADLLYLKQVSEHIDAIVLPKYSLSSLRSLSTYIEEHFDKGTEENPKVYQIWGLIESPQALLRLYSQLFQIRYTDAARFQHTQVRGFIFGGEDYAHVSGITRTPTLTEMLYPRQQLVANCRAWNLECLDLVSTNFRDENVLRAECRQGAEFGFTGKQAIHPNQIPIIHEAFSPSKEAIDHAQRLLEKVIAEDAGERRGAWELDGKMVDRPVIVKALRILRLAVNYNVVPNEAWARELLDKAGRLANAGSQQQESEETLIKEQEM